MMGERVTNPISVIYTSEGGGGASKKLPLPRRYYDIG